MLLLLLLASAPAQQLRTASGPAVVQARASVRILNAEPASKDWNDDRTAHKREILIRDDNGRLTRLRLVEHE